MLRMFFKLLKAIFKKFINCFKDIIIEIKEIKNDVFNSLAFIFSNLIPCVFAISNVVLLIKYYLNNGIIVDKFQDEISRNYFNDVSDSIFFLIILLAIIFIFIKYFKKGTNKKIIITILLIISIIAGSLCSYIVLGMENKIAINEAFATFITFGNPHNGLTLFYIYLGISLVPLIIALLLMKEWSFIRNILFSCAMYIMVLPILVLLLANIVLMFKYIIIGIIIGCFFDFGILNFIEGVGDSSEKARRKKELINLIEKK